MKLLIELPTWLGDAVMVSPAIENLVSHFNNAEITLIGSSISVEALENHPKVVKTFILDKKIYSLYKTILKLDDYDVFFSFRGSFRAKFLKLCVSAKKKFQYQKDIYKKGHQVEKYNNFVNDSLNRNSMAKELVVHASRRFLGKKNKLLGINPGASYGTAKQWYPENFARVALDLSISYDIVIFGGPQDINVANETEKYMVDLGIKNYQNLAAKLSISQLITQIANLDLFITCDSGPMHLAAAFQIPTIAIYGPTKDHETSQWMNKKSAIIKKNLECQPCMKRTCPLKHHNCMRLVTPSEIISASRTII